MGFPILFSFTSFRCEFLSQLLLIGTKLMEGHLGVFGVVFFSSLLLEGGEKEAREKENVWNAEGKEGENKS